MPGIQPRGTHALDPASEWAMEMLSDVNAEEDGAEDRLDPLDPLDSELPLPATQPASSSSFVNRHLGASSSVRSSSVFSSFPQPHLHGLSSSGGTRPLPPSSIPPSFHSMGSVRSIATGSDTGPGDPLTTVSEPGRKRKRDARSVSGIQPVSKKSATRSRANELNPVIISSALNSTLNRMADVMERSIDVTVAINSAPLATAPTTIPSVAPPSVNTSSSSTPLSQTEVLDQVIRTISANACLTDDELLVASLFFNSASEDAVRVAHTFICLGANQKVQHRFLLQQLEIAGLLPGKGKGKAVEDGDHSMVY